MDAQILESILRRGADGVALSEAELGELDQACRKYPYAAAFAVLRLANSAGLSAEQRTDLRRRLALIIDDPRTVDALRGEAWADFYPPEPDADADAATNDAIDVFLNTYGHRSAEEDALLERMIFNPTPDYAEVLAREEQENLPDEPVDPESPEGRIDAFILSSHPASPQKVAETKPEDKPAANVPIHKPTKENSDDTLLSESLARVYIKQRKYDRAYEIISNLSLKYPRKNSYFAVQLAYLRKLIICTKA